MATMSAIAQSIVKQSLLLYDARLSGARKALSASVVDKRTDAALLFLRHTSRTLGNCSRAMEKRHKKNYAREECDSVGSRSFSRVRRVTCQAHAGSNSYICRVCGTWRMMRLVGL